MTPEKVARRLLKLWGDRANDTPVVGDEIEYAALQKLGRREDVALALIALVATSLPPNPRRGRWSFTPRLDQVGGTIAGGITQDNLVDAFKVMREGLLSD